MTIAFVGHSRIFSQEAVKEKVKEQVQRCASEASVTCYLGGYGDFDMLCARACKELKAERGGVELVYVTPYLTPSVQAKIKEMQRSGLCDTSVYPPIENVPPRFAIAKRNEWIVANADLVIAYVEQACGGAYKTLRAARRRRKKIINISDLM